MGVSEAVGGEGHDLAHQGHRGFHRGRQFSRPGSGGIFGVAAFVRAHRLQNRTAALIRRGQAFEMSVEMGADLLFGFLDETEAPLVAGGAGDARRC